MELLRVFATLWQRRLLVLLGVALALAVVAKAPGSGAGATAGTALARVLVDTPDSMLVDVGPRGTNVSGMRTALLADKMMAGEVKAKIARAAGVPDDELLMRGASSDPPLVPGPLAQSASIATAGVTAPYAISVRPEAQVPIIEISVYAPDAASAARVASAATDTLESLNTAPEGDTSGAVVESLGPPLSQEIVAAESRKMAVIAAVILFAFWCGAIVLASGMARWWRAQAVRDALAPPAPRAAAGESLTFAISVVASDLRRAWQQTTRPLAMAGPRLAAAATSARGSIASARGTFSVARVAVTARGGKLVARGHGAAVRRRRPRRSILAPIRGAVAAAGRRVTEARARRATARAERRAASERAAAVRAHRAAEREQAAMERAGRLAAREQAAAAEHAGRAAARDRVAWRADRPEAHGKLPDGADQETAADDAAARAAAERAEQAAAERAEQAAAERAEQAAAERAERAAARDRAAARGGRKPVPAAAAARSGGAATRVAKAPATRRRRRTARQLVTAARLRLALALAAVAAAPGVGRRLLVHPRTLTALSLVVVAVPVAAAFLLLAEGGAKPDAAKQAPPPIPATPATFERVFDGARGGQTIALEAGDYGTFTGGSKASTVTLVAAAGANVKMALDFDPADHIKIKGVTLTSLELAGDTHDVTIENSTFTGPALIRADDMSDANVVLAGNRHAGIDKCDGCYEGRLTITGDSGATSGIVVTGSTFGPRGVSDGILNGGRGVQIVGNHFVGLQGGSIDGVHVDAIQLYGSHGTIIRGNRMEDVATGIMAPDGADHEVIEHNLIAPGEYPYAIFLGADVGSKILNNRLPDGECAFDKICGTIVIESGKDGTPSTGTVVSDNILGDLEVGEGSTLGANERNTIASDPSTDPSALGSTDALGIG